MRRIVALYVVTARGLGLFAPPAPTGSTPGGTPDVVELAATEARDRMAAGTLTSRALTQAYLNRIAAIDDAGPRLNAVIEINPTALADADALDAERRVGKVRGPLHGIPVLLKDNIDVVGMANSAGSLALADHRPAQRRVPRGAAARGRRGDRRQDEPERVGQLQVVAIDVGLELARRADEEPVCARSQPVRVQLGHRHGHRGQPRGDRRRHRNRRQHHLPRVGCRPCRPQADGRTGQPPRHHPDLGVPGHRRPDGANRGRCRAAAGRDRRR